MPTLWLINLTNIATYLLNYETYITARKAIHIPAHLQREPLFYIAIFYASVNIRTHQLPPALSASVVLKLLTFGNLQCVISINEVQVVDRCVLW